MWPKGNTFKYRSLATDSSAIGAFLQLKDAVRFALDYYATRLAAQRLSQKASQRKVGSSGFLVGNVWDVLEKHEAEIPPMSGDRA